MIVRHLTPKNLRQISIAGENTSGLFIGPVKPTHWPQLPHVVFRPLDDVLNLSPEISTDSYTI